MVSRKIFVTGGTGYIGKCLIPELLAGGHSVRALVRPGSEGKLPAGCEPVTGDALNAESFADKVAPCDTFIQLVGVPHPSPAKAAQFKSIDLVAGKAGIAAAKRAGVKHFIYLSVAQPAPIMKVYLSVRAECEALIRAEGLNATVLRPWYVIGPGHRWPLLIAPIYWLLERIPVTRDDALRLGYVSIGQMVRSICAAAEDPPNGVRVWAVPQIREF